MTRAEIEAAAKEKYPYSRPFTEAAAWATAQRAAYIQGRLDQAEADARIAEGYSEEAMAQRNDSDYPELWIGMQYHGMHHGAADVAIRIRKGVE